MKKRGDYLKKAYYHLMKIEQKKNKILQVENYGEINAELNRKFAKGEYFDSSEVYVEDHFWSGISAEVLSEGIPATVLPPG